MVRFRKIDESETGKSPIELHVRRADNGLIYGRIIGLSVHQIISSMPADPPIKEAARIVRELAIANNVSIIDLYDEFGLWEPSLEHLD
jgi:hypothetical protein